MHDDWIFSPADHADLAERDPALAPLIAASGTCPWRRPPDEASPFAALARSILYQQLSTKAADTIHARYLALFGGRGPDPEALAEASPEALRAAGVSAQKIRYLKDLAGQCRSGRLDLDRLPELEDAAILSALIQVKGIGPWTAQMFLIFHLGRQDVLAEGDLGLRNAIARLDRLETPPSPAYILARGEIWRPVRSLASWVLWRSLEPPQKAQEAD